MALFLNRQAQGPGASTSRHRRRRVAYCPFVEVLEDRTLPVITSAFSGIVGLQAAINVNVSQLAGYQSETAIDIDPTNPSRIVIASNNIANAAFIFTAWSNNAGANWNTVLVGNGNDGLGAGQVRCDPSVAFDDFGNVHLAYMTCTQGQPHQVVVLTSTDGGQTFPIANLRLVGAAGVGVDKPWIATGPNAQNPAQQSAWVTFMDNGNIRISGAAVAGLGPPAAFNAPALVNADGIGNVAVPAVGPAGQVIVVWQTPFNVPDGPTNIMADQDPDGLGPLTFGADDFVSATNVGSRDAIPSQPDRWIHASPVIDINRSGMGHNGRVYIAYADELVNGSNDTNILVRYSDDFGVNWSASVTANDDATTRSQFHAWLSVDQTTGHVGVGWYDARLDGGVGGIGDGDGHAPNGDGHDHSNNEVFYFGTVSIDAGTVAAPALPTFLPNVQISAGRSSQSVFNPNFDQNNFGDYSGVTFFGGSLYATWADNSNSTGNNPNGTYAGLDIYVNRVTFTAASGQVITLTGTAGNDRYDIRNDASATFVQFYENNQAMTGVPTFTATNAAINRVDANLGLGADIVLVNAAVTRPFNVVAGGGNDNVTTGAGNDTIQGGADNDILAGSSGTDRLVESGGSFTLSGIKTNGTLTGFAGTDTVSGFEQAHLTGADATNDTITAASYTDSINVTLSGGAGIDSLVGGTGTDCLLGGTGNDTLVGGAGHDSLYGGDDNDTLYGGDNNDTLWGEAGNDDLRGNFHVDCLMGGSGNDTLWGQKGRDSLYGGNDNDSLAGLDGDDSLVGDAGDDSLQGGAGWDTLDGGTGTNTLVEGLEFEMTLVDQIGPNGSFRTYYPQYDTPFYTDDVLIGDTIHRAQLTGGNQIKNKIDATRFLQGPTTLRGGINDDTLLGSPQADQLFGEGGNDFLDGFDDLLVDALDGGAGTADKCIIHPGDTETGCELH